MNQAARERIADVSAFECAAGRGRARCRVQVFTGSGEPVVLLTQDEGEGTSLSNGIEDIANAVWRNLLPDQMVSPGWLQRDIYRDERTTRQVTFSSDGPYLLHSPHWSENLTKQRAEGIVGCPLDLERGSGYRPDPEDIEYEDEYRVAWMLFLPRPKPFRRPGCMRVGIPWPRRLLRQLRPTHEIRDCCWYHGGDWHSVSRHAVKIARRGKRDSLSMDEVIELANETAHGLDDWSQGALMSLFSAEPITVSRAGYGGGQHRTQAMLDAGVRRTVQARSRAVRSRHRAEG